MSGAVNPSECANAAIMLRISITLEKKLEVLFRMKDGQTHADGYRRNFFHQLYYNAKCR
jgi:hypothetical protein